MWWRSFPFHFGLYLVIAATVLLGVAGAAPTLGGPCRSIAVVAGASGLGLSILGALGLLHRRLTAPDLADFTTAADLFNLVFFVVAFGVSFATFALFDRDFALLGRFVANVVTFRPEAVAGGAAGLMLALSASLLAVLLAYIPLTHMSHFVGKWFAYHSIRWNDEPNLQGGPHEPAIAHLLQQKVTWAAPHIQGGGKESWADLAGKTDYERSGK
jgi:nitrate reductase gamma subunit